MNFEYFYLFSYFSDINQVLRYNSLNINMELNYFNNFKNYKSNVSVKGMSWIP